MATKGLVIVYTGDGKGKTTAALGLGMRAAGQGLKVFILQFMKGEGRTGEIESISCLPNMEIEQAGRANFVDAATPDPMDMEAAAAGLQKAKSLLVESKQQMLILDEVNVAVDYGLLDESDVLSLIETKPSDMHLVLTGRNASDMIIAAADLVSEVKDVKHPYRQGVVAQKGIEY